MDVAAFRSRFPVLRRVAYLNAGTCGPVPAEAVIAARAALAAALHDGRGPRHFEARLEARDRLREGYARVLGCEPGELAVTTSTSEGIGKTLLGLGLQPGDEVLTSDEEHPAVYGPLLVAREAGVVVRVVAVDSLVEAVGPATSAIVCQHVNWATGRVAPVSELAATGVPVILDGAQGAGAIATDVRALGCAAYAGAGQKWLCGADGSGFLYVSPALQERLVAVAPAYGSMVDPGAGLDSPLHPDARRHDTPVLAHETVALSLASLEVLEGFGLARAHARATELAETLAAELEALGKRVVPRGETTLVSWEERDPGASVERCAQAGVVVRDIPGRPYVRASVGAWSDESDLERLLGVVA